MEKNRKNVILIKNTSYLYLLTVSTQLLNVIYIPYITRVFGPERYGMISLALSIMAYLQLTLDMGFILSATSSVSEHENDIAYLSKLFSMITVYKAFAGLLLISLLTVICYSVEALKGVGHLVTLYGIAYLLNAFLPDYIYRGKQKMKNITLRTILVKLIFTVLVFVLVKNREDYIKLPLLLMIGNAIALLISYIDLRINFGIGFRGFSFYELKYEVKKAFPFYVSRIASTCYQALNTIMIGFIYPGQAEVGYYGSADKMAMLVKTASSPIADSIYPYMLKEKNYRLIKRLIILYAVLAAIVTWPVFMFAPDIAGFVFGNEYRDAGQVIRYLLPGMLVIFPSYLICFPVLVPLSHSKEANISNIIGAVIQCSALLVMWITGKAVLRNICIMASISEVVVFLYRLFVWIKYRDHSK